MTHAPNQHHPSVQIGAAASTRLDHAVVIGGSMAGLLAARALAPYVKAVTVIERDAPPAAIGQARKGVPQGEHAHLLLSAGLYSLEQLFPGIRDEIEAISGPAFDAVQDTRWKIEGAFRPRFASRFRLYALGRPALESLVRRRVAALENVTLRRGSVSGLRVERKFVTGVELEGGDTLRSDLVVDASGRGTRAHAWLERAGFTPPEPESDVLGLCYSSCVVAPGAGFDYDFRMLLIPPSHACARGGLLVPLESGRYMATLITYGDELPPLEWEGFRASAARVGDPLFAQVLARCVPLSEPRRLRIPRRTFWRYDRLAQPPQRFIALGDALCSFDPAFGQGMSVCALEARALEQLLARRRLSLERLPKVFFGLAAALVDAPWSMRRARGDSPRHGKPATLVRFSRAYQRELLRAAAGSAALHLAFLRVVNLEAQPSSLLWPRIALRVFGHRLRRALVGEPRSLDSVQEAPCA